ncbi:uncharacterized protein TRUGW13939_08560 [Talaromyces rugulosus]|uniref:Uncharacterized protein n=1 Tax=Talaromyces rugulosus TaxID=121627 RepID=A0A7H8R4Y5_TALRU|nr:uncharacterized protein TRUGW13939_08560 [Talaromyces rugulosus]QKX61412.1 hypothetical protein TRUGW13939_08560 [Talaromyces rugulosus]
MHYHAYYVAVLDQALSVVLDLKDWTAYPHGAETDSANSQYFAIIPETDEAVAPDGDACETLIQNMQAHWRSVQEAADRKIQAGQVDEANPWLRRTEWVKYLGEFDIPDLI